MKVPSSGRRVALAIIDVQEAFVTTHSKPALANIIHLIKATRYWSYVEAVFSAERGSLWDRQTNWTLPNSSDIRTVDQVSELLQPFKVRRIQKHTKSIFNTVRNEELVADLLADGIEEIHIVGFDINDCVLATALDSFDRGFFTYVIEECCASSDHPGMRDHAMAILRHLNLTNNSVVERVRTLEVPQTRSMVA